MKLSSRLIAILFSWTVVSSTQAGAILDTEIVGGQLLVATEGNVFAEFLGGSAGYFNVLYFESRDESLFNKYSTVISDGGDRIDLGYFEAGTELVFRLDVFQFGGLNRMESGSGPDESYFTGDSSRNRDGIAHASAITRDQSGVFVTDVGFEDLLGGGDLDFNDIMFRLYNVIDPPPARVSAPPVLFLMLFGVFGLLARRFGDVNPGATNYSS